MNYTSSNYSSCTFKESPEAVVTVNRNRLKQYNGTYFIKDQTNFELEIFNPLTFKIGAQITLQGVNIGMILLKPGERIYLDRFINENKKFLFTSYEVDFNNTSLNAIRNNGDLEITFFKEQELVACNSAPYWYTNLQVFNQPPIINNIPGTTAPYMLYNSVGQHCTITSNSSNTVTSNTADISGITFTGNSFYTNGINTQVRHKYQEKTVTPKDFRKVKSNNFVTGIVEKGDSSNQNLTTTYGNYTIYINKVSYKLLPYENRPVEATEIRKYCTSCGVRIKKTNMEILSRLW